MPRVSALSCILPTAPESRAALTPSTPLRIAIDATPLTEPHGGIARYTREIAAALATEFPDDQYALVSDQDWTAGALPANLRAGRRPRSWIARRWWTVGLPLELARLDASVFHGSDFAVPYVPLRPSVMTLHDLSPWLNPELRPSGSERVRRRAPLLAKLATMILTPTETIRRQTIEHFGLPPSRVVAVPLAAGPEFRPRTAAETMPALARLGVAPPYLLFIGTRERRKNLTGLLDAWRQARRRQPDLDLVVVGPPMPDEAGLIAAGSPPDADLAALLAAAAIFVYPSLYEGFGLPVLEAMQSGTPVVISRDPALAEVAGDSAVPVDAASTASLADAIIGLLANPGRREELRTRGLRRAAEFSWRRTAVRTREVYVEALRRF